MMTTYGRRFFAKQATKSLESARVIVPIVTELLGECSSVLDVGCGVGSWLSAWRDAGVGDVMGLDGDYVQGLELVVPTECFSICDLTVPVDLGRRYDLVESVEVAEHLPIESADAFVASLTRHSDAVLFSAALPGQSGKGHLNEQLPKLLGRKVRDP